MGARGVHFALDETQVEQVLAAAEESDLQAALDDVEEAWDEEWLCEVDKAWDAIHRCLSDGSLEVPAQRTPLVKAVLGGRELSDNADVVAALLTPEEVREVSEALEPLTETWLRERLSHLAAHGYEGPGDADDFRYTWDNLCELRDFYRRAAAAGRATLFSVNF